MSAARLLTASAALLLACLLPGCSSGGVVRPLKPGGRRQAAPDFALKDADGKTVHLSDYKGKVVILDFWATTCGPCKIEIPWFMDLERNNRARGFAVLGVDMDDNGWEDVRPFLTRYKINYRIVMGDDSTSRKFGGIEAIPTTFLIDKQGRVAAVHVGLNSGGRKEFEDGVEELLREPDRPPAAAGDGPVPAPAVVPER